MHAEGFHQLRVWFKKTGSAKYISHLDLNRCMTRAVRRAHIPLWYTEGFNPHPYLTFALPLSLGHESEAEPMDIRIEGEMENEEIRARLEKVMPEGIEITEVTEAGCDPKEICYADYEILLVFANAGEAENFAGRAKELLSGGELSAEKPGKQGRQKVMKKVDLKEYIFSFDIGSEAEKVLLQVTLSAGNTTNLNPALLLESLNAIINSDIISKRIRRKRLLKADFEAFR
jgi:radical SAM-linked protein